MSAKAGEQGEHDGSTKRSAALKELRIGVKLKHARMMRGMRLRDVAAKAGCSESLISKVENGRANPSINTLHRIANVLGINIGQLFAKPDERQNVIHRKGERRDWLLPPGRARPQGNFLAGRQQTKCGAGPWMQPSGDFASRCITPRLQVQ
jgi:transcriptional regulator with XRE-family HTH domain